MAELSASLLRGAYPLWRNLRLIGVGLSDLRSSGNDHSHQLDHAV
ncbi:hypothetical protein [Methylobacterium iners]